MQEFLTRAESILWSIFNRPTIADVVDIIIVAFLLYKLLMLTKETRASAVLKGLVVLFLATWISDLFGLTAMSWILTNVLSNGALVLVILFQPELRKALEQIGRGTIRDSLSKSKGDSSDRVINEIANCMMNLSRRRVGALIVLEQKIGLKDVVETGTMLNAEISAALLENIFEPNTPLHDGAVLIRGDKVMAAGCILSLSDGKGISHELGTRHRAALGISETTDAISLIVSEETGIISFAREGRLTRHLDRTALEEVLASVYTQKEPGLLATLLEKRKQRKEG
ncbi:MAG: TIGR00159 family protein [Clostridiales bacterium]|nr:TIGR00159 family protein [Clostridiales bacterium]